MLRVLEQVPVGCQTIIRSQTQQPHTIGRMHYIDQQAFSLHFVPLKYIQGF